MKRRTFLTQAAAAAGGLAFAASQASATPGMTTDDISLAAWSLIKEFRAGEWKNIDLPRICREEFDIGGVEYVNTLFEVPTNDYLRRLNRVCDDNGVRSQLIMCDAEGSMASTSAADRRQAVINHRKWVDIAAYLGCHSIRTNCRSDDESDQNAMLGRAEESFNQLLEYAIPAGINVIIENHGGMSSNPDFLLALMRRVNNGMFGVLPDFGNFPDDVDKVDALRRLTPYAKGMSVKTYFNEDGTHPRYDVAELIRTCHAAGYHGFYGIETENGAWGGAGQIRMTKRLLQETLGLG